MKKILSRMNVARTYVLFFFCLNFTPRMKRHENEGSNAFSNFVVVVVVVKKQHRCQICLVIFLTYSSNFYSVWTKYFLCPAFSLLFLTQQCFGPVVVGNRLLYPSPFPLPFPWLASGFYCALRCSSTWILKKTK